MPSMNSSGNVVGLKRFLEVEWKIVHLVLSMLIDNLFDLNQIETLFSSLFICWNNSFVYVFTWSK